jgi:hypothetical protein
LVAATLLLGGCVARGAAAPAPQTQDAAPEGDVTAQARAVIAEVVRLRGLAELRPIQTRVVDTATFNAIFAAKVKREERPKDAARGVQRPPDSYLGFYDEFSKVIVLRTHLPKWASDSGTQPADLLAHEVVHALQDQHFGIPDTSKIDDDDRLLAIQALYEGDAQLLAEAYHAKMRRQSGRHAALYAFEQATISADVGIRSGVFSPSLLDLPPARREAFAFPYLSGIAFASALYRAGGFALIDRAFARPPQTTAEILEPSRYLAGDKPATIDSPVLPAGSSAPIDAPVGEFGLSLVVANLSAKAAPARLAVLGWNGARLTEFVGPGGAGTVLSTEWKSEADARRFGSMLKAGMEARGLPGVPSDLWAVDADGTSVAFVLGSDAPAFARRTLHRARPAAPPEPPLGLVVLPPPPVPLAARMPLRGTITDALYRSPWLGLRGAVPSGFAADTYRPEAQLVVVRHQPTLAIGMFTVCPSGSTEADRTRLHDAYIETLVGASEKATRPVRVSSGPAHTAVDSGTQVTWRLSIGGAKMFARDVVVAVCDGNAALEWATLWAAGADVRDLDAWPESFEVTSPGTSPACDDFHRESADDESP